MPLIFLKNIKDKNLTNKNDVDGCWMRVINQSFHVRPQV
jgi:hypothetical protein